MRGSRVPARRSNTLSILLYTLAAVSVLFGVFVLLAMISISANISGFVSVASGFGGPLSDMVAGYVQSFLNFIAAMTFLLLLVLGVTLFIQARLLNRSQELAARIEELERRLAGVAPSPVNAAPSRSATEQSPTRR